MRRPFCFTIAVVLVWSAVAQADYMDHFVMREDVGPHKAPYVGRASLLVIPVEVAGFPPLDTSALAHFFSADDANGFVHYYQTASLNRYQPTVAVAPVVRFAQCPLPADKFPQCSIARGDVSALGAGMNMVRDIVKRAHDEGLDFSQFDVNGRRGEADGWIDGVMILLNVPFGGIALPFAFFNRDDNLNGGLGGPMVVDGLNVGHIAIAGDGDAFVLVHEFGHLLGLTDLYDESQNYAGLYLSVMGAWGYDAAIPLPDAETRFRLRWANWHQVQGRERVRIRPAETSGDVFRLGTGDEYFLIENRGPGGQFDANLPERGLAIFHVDRTVKLGGNEGQFVNRLIDCVNCNPWRPYIRLLQADGQFDIEQGFAFGKGDVFTPGTSLSPSDSAEPFSATHRINSTNYYSGLASGLSVEDITLLQDGTIEATLTAADAGQCDERLCADGEGCAPSSCGAPEPEATPPSGCTVSWALFPLLAVAWGRRAVSLKWLESPRARGLKLP